MSDFNLNDAVAALKASVAKDQQNDLEATLTRVLANARGPKGEQGPAGRDAIAPVVRDGKDGLSGKDAEPINLILGKVSAADYAAAELKRTGSTYVLNLTLPRGERGLASTAAGPSGIQGRPGKDANPISSEAVEAAARKILSEPAIVEKLRGHAGPAGASVKGEPGCKGDPGLTREEALNIMVEVMNTTGVLNFHAKKLVELRAKLKKTIHDVDGRYMAEYSALLKECDKVFDYVEPVVPVTAADVARIVAEALAGKDKS
jgi:hypothetical protein